MNLLVVGASHRTADVALLEQLSIPATEVAGALDRLLRREHVTEAVVLSTCNRVEVYAGVTAFHGGVADVSAALAEQAGLDPAALAAHLYVHWDADAVSHALRVAAGLDSMVAGEAQILGQVREAYAAAAEAGATGRLLHELMQQALRVGKRVHAETGIDAAGRNIVTAALSATSATIMGVSRRVDGGSDAKLHDRREQAPAETLAGRSALVIGAGSMGALALATLTRAGAGPLYIANRDPERAQRLAASYSAEPVELARIGPVMSTVDMVVSVTASVSPVLSAATVAAAVADRPADRGPLVICDLAIPRDVEPATADLPGVVLIDLERLAASARGADGASDEVMAAERLVAAEAATVGKTLRDTQVAPTVAALRARADEVVTAELQRLAQRCPDLTDEQRAEVAHAVHRLVQRLLHQPTVRIRQLAAGPNGENYTALFAELFDLQVPQPRRADELPSLERGAAT
ncbi:MAG TPA: glutamyl-tRNA reductase [Natronosporangium sp.]